MVNLFVLLKSKFFLIKKKEVLEQLGSGLVISGVVLTPSLLIENGIFIIVIIIICSTPKKFM